VEYAEEILERKLEMLKTIEEDDSDRDYSIKTIMRETKEFYTWKSQLYYLDFKLQEESLTCLDPEFREKVDARIASCESLI
jgi:hypothetical protein